MEWLRRLDENPLTERVIMALILVNAVTRGLETSGGAMERYDPLLIAIDRIAIAIFVVEILARLIVQRAAFFSDGWNIFGEEHAENESKPSARSCTRRPRPCCARSGRSGPRLLRCARTSPAASGAREPRDQHFDFC
jgi:hypothetical protein